MSTVDGLLQRLWEDYANLNPRARAVHDLLTSLGETVLNDHIAFRTYNDSRINIDQLAKPFLAGGYKEAGEYTFEQKKLDARHFQHEDESMPKVFISELRLQDFSDGLQEAVKGLVDQVPIDLPGSEGFPVCGRPWDIDFASYEKLRTESEYAGWLSAFGFRANHFTVNVNALQQYGDLVDLNALLKENDFPLNDSGGEIKGSPDVYLEQSSTMAADVPISFSDGTHEIPACYYEFAKRHPLPDGKLFQGFVARSADKIFESTDRES